MGCAGIIIAQTVTLQARPYQATAAAPSVALLNPYLQTSAMA
jgi:hypothetical protein